MYTFVIYSTAFTGLINLAHVQLSAYVPTLCFRLSKYGGRHRKFSTTYTA